MVSLCLLQGIVPNFSTLLFLTSQFLEVERLLNPVLNQWGTGLFKFICRLELIALRFRSFDILVLVHKHSAVLISTDKQSIEQAASQSFHRLCIKALWHRIIARYIYIYMQLIQIALTVVNAVVCYQFHT